MALFDVSVAVVGAGASGLAAAMTLFMAGIQNVTILEAADRIGGRIKRFTIKNYDGEIKFIHVVEVISKSNDLKDSMWTCKCHH